MPHRQSWGTAAIAAMLFLSACGQSVPSGTTAGAATVGSAAAAPTSAAQAAPTVAPTQAPVAPTVAPTIAPTVAPTEVPTAAPTVAPTAAPAVALTPAAAAQTGSTSASCGTGSFPIPAGVTMTSDLTQLVDVFQKIGQARCKTKTVRVTGTSTDQTKNTNSTFVIEVVQPDQYHFKAGAPTGTQGAGSGTFELIGIGQDVYFRQGDAAWQVPPPQAKSQMSSIYANGLAQAFTFDFSGAQSRTDPKATPNPTAVAEMQAMSIKKTSATKQGVVCDDYQVTVPSSNASPTVFSICVDPGKNLPVEWDISTTTATTKNSVVIAYQWDIPITIVKPIP